MANYQRKWHVVMRFIHSEEYIIFNDIGEVGIPDMRPTAIYFINSGMASMVMVPNFQPKRSSIVINNYLTY